MATAYICYSRPQQKVVKELASDLKHLGYDVWFDRKLAGGKDWWNEILERIEACDVFVYVLAADSMSSEACEEEFKWARVWRRQVLPVRVEEHLSAARLPEVIARSNIIDYKPRDHSAFIKLKQTTEALGSSGPSPEKPPQRPPPPGLLINRLKDAVANPETALSDDAQWDLLRRIKEGRWRKHEIEAVLDVLNTLQAHPSCRVPVAQDADALIARYEAKLEAAKPRPEPPPPAEDEGEDEEEEAEEKKETSVSDVVGFIVVALIVLAILQDCSGGMW